VIAIQPTNPRKNLSLEDVFREVDATGAFRNFVFLMDPGYKKAAMNLLSVRGRVLRASPATSIRILDGRKFGFLNAEYIQKISGIPW
jgi:hypothetical protein